MVNILLCTVFGSFASETNIPKMNATFYQEELSCLTIANFNMLTDYIKKYGEQIQLSNRLVSDAETLSLEVSIGNRYIELENYQDHERII